MAKPRVIKDFSKLDLDIQEQIKLTYPTGFFEHLISYVDKDGNERWALPFETEEKYYMVRMTVSEAKKLINDDEDYDDNGVLRNDVQELYQEKYNDIEFDDFAAIDEAPVEAIGIDAKELEVDDEEDDEEALAKKKKKEEDYDDDDEDEDEIADDEDLDDDEDEE